jgi:hypothetical protein
MSDDPLGFTKYAYGWKEGVLASSEGVRPWQREILQHIGRHLQGKSSRYTPCQIAVASGHGIGKSALIAMVCHWAMSTCDDCKIIVTANTGTQLSTKTGPEITKWFKLGINAHWFETKATSITVRDPGHERTWRLDLIPWSENNTEAFAGLHNLGKRIVVIMDEASSIAAPVWEVTEGALTDENTEIIWLAFGNPTQNTGRFRECFGSRKHRWTTFQIDSRNVEGTNKAKIAQWIADYGEDSDFVRVRVRGEFPRAGSSQFIPNDIVAAARKYQAEGFANLPKILSLDVARFGDDQSVLLARQGRKATILAKWRGLDTVEQAERFIEAIKNHNPDACIIDAVGVGAGVIDQVRFRGYKERLFEYTPNMKAENAAAYRNCRTEMWGRMRDWLKAGAEIPDDAEMETDLTSPEYFFSSNEQVQLESKEDMKARGLASPDCGDALAMTFQPDVRPLPKSEAPRQYGNEVAQSWMS